MSIAAQPLTYAALRALPDLGERYELIDGELFVPPAPVPLHQRLSHRLLRMIDRALGDERLMDQVYYAPVDVVLSDRRVLQPDLVFIRSERRAIIGPEHIMGAPDVVVEILSPGSRARDLRRKRELYAEAGVREHWVIDPRDQTVTLLVQVSGAFQPVVPGADGLRSLVIPGLIIDPVALFASA